MERSLKAILNLALLTLLAALLEGCETATPEERQSSTTWILVFAVIFLIGFLFILSTSLVYDQLENGRPTAILGLLISCGCLIPSLALWIAYVGQRETLESVPEQWQADGAILLTFAIGCTLVFIFASLSLGHLAMIADAKNKTALMPWVLMHGVFCMLSLAATFSLWISVAGHEGGTNCTKLQALSPTFCAEQSLAWISPAPDGFSASECCHQLMSSTMTTTVTQTTTRTLPSRQALPCLCNASGAELLCETGTGQVCSLLDTEERTEACFAEGTLCTPATLCRTRASLSADCSRFLEEPDCSRQAACVWEDAEVNYAYQCRPAESQDAISVGLCAGYLSKSSCNEQIICKWQLVPLGEERCSNGGSWRGCISSIPSLDHLCSEFKTSPDCATDRFCQWSATCNCADDFFGDLCEKQVAPFSRRSGCTGPVGPGEMCQAIVYAASASDRFRCATTGLDVACSDWLRLKETAEVMYEAELGGTVVDFLAFFLGLAISFSIHKMSNFYGYRRFALFALVVSFLADLTLEAILSTSVSAAANVLDRFKECASQETNGDSSFTKMKATADWIRILAFANIIIASIGLCGDIAGAALDWSRDPAIKAGLLLVTHLAGGLEAVIGLFSWRLNTEPFIEELQAVEMAALGLEELERGRGQMCFTRHPDLSGPEVVSMGWSNPIIYILLPGALTLVSLSLALVVAFCVPRSANEVMEMELPTGRRRVRPAPVMEFEKPTPPGKPRQPEAVAPKGQAPPPLNPTKTAPDKPRQPEAVAPKGQSPPPLNPALNPAKTAPDKPRQPEAVAPKEQAPPPLNPTKSAPDKPRQPEPVAPKEQAPPPLDRTQTVPDKPRQPEAVAPEEQAPPPLDTTKTAPDKPRQPEAVAPNGQAPPPLNHTQTVPDKPRQPEAVAPKGQAPPPLIPAKTVDEIM